MCSLFNVNLKTINASAHSKKDNNGTLIKKEEFSQHCLLVLKYYNQLLNQFGIEDIYDNLLNDIDSTFDKTKFKCYFEKIILFHDIGKLTKNFQAKLNGENKSETHSDKSFYLIIYELLLQHKQKKINSKEYFLLFILSYAVLKHHGSLNNILEDIAKMTFSRNSAKISEIESSMNLQLDKEILELMENKAFWEKWDSKENRQLFKKLSEKSLSLFILTKLFYSLLVTSDYYATLEFMEGRLFAFDVLDNNSIDVIYKNFHCTKNINNFNNFNVDINNGKTNLKQIDICNINNLNELRSKLNVEAEDNLSKMLNNNLDNNVFFLNIPTGGGKTNISLRLALQIMKQKENIRKLFYVFPFINIIEQSYGSLEKFIGSDNMTRLDSRYIDPKTSDDYDKNALYANYIDSLFFNKKVLFTSHVKFFDLFFRNDKNTNYNFFQLANSVVIIDEIQAYNDKVWTEISHLLKDISKFMNTYFIVMSATLPEIGKLSNAQFNEDLSVDVKDEDIIGKLSNAQFNYVFDDGFTKKILKHKCFERNIIKPIDKEKKDIVKEIKNENNRNKILIVFNTVKDSREFYEKINNDKSFEGYEKYLLNSTILDCRRKDILEECKKEDNKKIILVSTQSVEAGVDIDFDVGFRAYAPWDSIIQVAGRVNRNNKKKSICDVFVFKDKDYKEVYRDDVKAGITKNKENEFFEKMSIKEVELLPEFYKEIIGNINNVNKNPFIKSSAGNVADMKNLFFDIIDKEIHLIEGETLSLYIPIDDKANNLWDDYKKLFEDEKCFDNIIKIKNKRKELQQYSINIFDAYTSKGKLSNILREEINYGYYYCENWNKYYSVETGLDPDNFKKIVLNREALIL